MSLNTTSKIAPKAIPVNMRKKFCIRKYEGIKTNSANDNVIY
jgi:hypothetical protein